MSDPTQPSQLGLVEGGRESSREGGEEGDTGLVSREGLLEEKTEAKMNSSRYEEGKEVEESRTGRSLCALCFRSDILVAVFR